MSDSFAFFISHRKYLEKKYFETLHIYLAFQTSEHHHYSRRRDFPDDEFEPQVACPTTISYLLYLNEVYLKGTGSVPYGILQHAQIMFYFTS